MSAERDQSTASVWPAIVVSGIILMGLGWVIWKNNHAEIAYFMLKVSYYQAIPLAFVSGSNAFLTHIAELSASPHTLRFGDAYAVLARAGFPYSLIVFSLAAGIALSVRMGPFAKAVRRMDADTLVESLSHSFSAVAPIVGKDITKDDSPQWAPSKRPEDYANTYRLVVAGKLDRRAAMSVLLNDLGKPVEHPDKMTDAWKALFAVLCEMATGKPVVAGRKDEDPARDVINALNYSAMNATCSPDYSLSNDLYQKHRNGDLFKTEVMYHRYAGTLIFRLLELAREKRGVLPSSEFIWVKPNDRKLWYVINTAGRKVAFIESAAVFAQYGAEKVARNAGMSLKEPCLEEAVDALERDLFKTGTVESMSETWS